MRRAPTQKPGFFAKSGEDVKNIAETRFLGLSTSGFTHPNQRNRVFTKFFDFDGISAKKPGFWAHVVLNYRSRDRAIWQSRSPAGVETPAS